MKCFNGFCKEGVVHAETVSEILSMMGLRVKQEALDAIIAEVDEDGKNWFFVVSYVVTDKNKHTERDVDNDIPHWEGLGHVKNSLFRSRQSQDGTLNSRRVLTPQNVDIIVHIPWDEL